MVPPSIDPLTNVQSKDIIISPENNISARLYLPKNPDPHNKLPLLVYFHGGAFLVESAFSQKYHKHLNLLVKEANVVALSVDYRLAPEHPLPIAYEDSWLALKWVSAESEKEEWIRDYADLNRLYLGGDSAGGNIAHKLAILIGTELLTGIKLCGVFLNCPFFGGEVAIGDEVIHKSYTDNLWRYVSPSAIGCDEPWINPGMDPGLSSFGCKRVLVYVAENDMLRGRGWYYKEALEKSGWGGEVEVVDVEGEVHVFSVNFPDGKSAMTMFKRLASFLNS
ncbi:hypothetical protein RD792_017682 [Penstemon davidsonii]|uniref:Alpha/beta hydrolase fold-3 domain-containing protein n=1 Tax=Penstemon davidsonii TaxID=160366 RepID=A0ABR0DWN8_9LAMI|nr:hypothetical protein RD792_017682 [Penstemon davidsonii]